MKTMTTRDKRTVILSSLCCLLPLAAGLVLYPRLPDRLAIHWGADGQPNGYSSRLVAVVGMPLFFLAINLLLHFCLRTDPKRSNASRSLVSISYWIAPIMGILTQTGMLANALIGPLDMTTYVLVLVGVLIMLVGNYLPKSRQSYTVGIKTPWALHDAENWRKTHRLAGPLWVIGGLLLALSGFVRVMSRPAYVAFAVMVCAPIVYSYLLYRNKRREG